MRLKTDDSEADVKRSCVKWLRAWGAIVVRVNSGGSFFPGKQGGAGYYVKFNDEDGCSDCLACLPGGLFCAVEFKKPGRDNTKKDRREKQRLFRVRVEECGGVSLVVRSLDELQADLRDLGYDTTIRYTTGVPTPDWRKPGSAPNSSA